MSAYLRALLGLLVLLIAFLIALRAIPVSEMLVALSFGLCGVALMLPPWTRIA